MKEPERLLYILSRREIKSQRALAGEMGISLGQVNYLLKRLADKGWICREGACYRLTDEGRVVLEEQAEKNLTEKLDFKEKERKVRLAVLLAAGQNPAFQKPEGLLEVGGLPVIEHLIQSLLNQGIERIVVVIGYKKEQYEAYFSRRQVTLAVNDRYEWSGTMASLAKAKSYLTEDFLLVEANQILEEEGIERLLREKEPNGMLLAAPSGSKDEAYVELDDEGGIFRIAKDIRQLNRIDGELIGACKISKELFEKMLKYYERNENPYLNYEYAIESIGRVYHISGILADDLVWSVIENEDLYRKAADILYPKMKKRMLLKKENRAKETLRSCLERGPEDILQIRISGGMTNQNFFVELTDGACMLRMPGACTDVFIDREAERQNTMAAQRLGLNPPLLYFDPHTGVKIAEYIKGAKTLNPGSAKLEGNMKKTAGILKLLHGSRESFMGTFDVWGEYEKYRRVILENGGSFYEGYQELEAFFYRLRGEVERFGIKKTPCHNDLVAENFVMSGEGRLYLIDWEYAGYNDPLWDVAAHLLECSFSVREQELYLFYYLERKPEEQERKRLLIYKICQDVLWSAWTIAKETKGEDFGAYGQERFQRALRMKKAYEESFDEQENSQRELRMKKAYEESFDEQENSQRALRMKKAYEESFDEQENSQRELRMKKTYEESFAVRPRPGYAGGLMQNGGSNEEI